MPSTVLNAEDTVVLPTNKSICLYGALHFSKRVSIMNYTFMVFLNRAYFLGLLIYNLFSL